MIGIGSCAVDLLGIVPSFPKPDTKNKMIRLIRQGGGPVGTALVTLARLGAKVSFVGKLGNNEFSRFVINEFTQEEVDTSGTIKEEEKAGPYFAFIMVDEKKGSRTIWWTDEMVSRLKKEELSKDFITSCQILHLDEYDLPAALLAATWAKEKGIKTVLDAETPEKRELLPLIKLIDFLIVPEEFALSFSGASDVEKASEFFLKRGPGVVVVTQGKRGSLTKTEDESFFQSAFKVPVVDTTGCGDVFHGGFIYGLLKDWPIEITAEFASAVAAIKCKKLGGRAGCPSFETSKGFLLSFGSERIKSFLK